MQKVLITGCAGYIGTIVTECLLTQKFGIVGIDDCRTGFMEPMERMKEKFGDQFEFYRMGIESYELTSVLEKHSDIDLMIHLAASSKVDESVAHPQAYQQNNIEAAKRLFEQVKKRGIKKVIFASSAAVYGEAKYLPIDEDHPLVPANPYGKTKLEGERILHELKDLGIKSVIFRFFNVCGASMDGKWGDSRRPSSALVQNVVRGAMKLDKFELTCSKVDTPDNTTIRDYVDVTDIARACVNAIGYLNAGGETTVINLGSGIGVSIKEVVQIGNELLGVKTQVKMAKRKREGEVSKVVANNGKAKRVLEWQPRIELEDSVKSLIAWYKLHPSGWKY